MKKNSSRIKLGLIVMTFTLANLMGFGALAVETTQNLHCGAIKNESTSSKPDQVQPAPAESTKPASEASQAH